MPDWEDISDFLGTGAVIFLMALGTLTIIFAFLAILLLTAVIVTLGYVSILWAHPVSPLMWGALLVIFLISCLAEAKQ